MKLVGYFLLILTICTGSLFAVNGNMGNHDGYVPDGSQSKPWFIEDYADFQEFVSDSDYWAAGSFIVLRADIDLSPSLEGRQIYLHSPLGHDTEFNATFKGNGHTISNLKVVGGDYSSLFGFCGSSAVIEFINIVNADIQSDGENVGILAGKFNGTKLIKSFVSGSVSGVDIVGGLVGDISASDVCQCSSVASVEGDCHVGGLVGVSSFANYSNCRASGVVNGEGHHAGGFIGHGVYGSVFNSFSNCSVTGGNWTGGFIGYVAFTEILFCYSSGLTQGNSFSSSFIGSIGSIGDENEPVGCFWNTESGGLDTGLGAIGIPASQMADINTFLDADWDFVDENHNGDDDIWFMDGYPDIVQRPGNIVVLVPDIVGLTQNDAESTISDFGVFFDEITYDFSPILSENLIIFQVPQVGSVIETGDTISIVVSLGSIPNLIGLSEADAESLLLSRGFETGVVNYDFDDTIAAGHIISQEIPIGEVTETFRSFSYVVSLGSIPNLIGLSEADAESLLLSRGFETGVVNYGFDDTIAAGHIIYQELPVGEETETFRSFSYTVSLGTIPALSGTGRIDDPYLITSYADFIGFYSDPIYWQSQIYVKLTADIDLDPSLPGRTVYSAPLFNDYRGNFDGGGHVIRNYVSTNGMFGSFTSYNYGRLYNLGIEDAEIISTSSNVGILCDSFKGGSIVKCYTTGTISGADNVGGLCGEISNSTIETCFSTARVTGQNNVGGLYGVNYSGYSNIHSCYFNGQVTGVSNVGGLCGYNKYSFINECYSKGIVSGDDCVGGFCGNTERTIQQSYSNCAVSGMSNVGGFSGTVAQNYYLIGCFWDTDTSGISTDPQATGLTTSQMQDREIFIDAGWDFNDETLNGAGQVWYMDGYPELVWDIVIAPNISGVLEEDAIASLIASGLNLGTVEYSLSLRHEPGYVDYITGTGGSLTYPKTGASIDLVVSNEKVPGNGTENDPYQIQDFRIFKFVFYETEAANSSWNTNFMLTGDIDLDLSLPGRSEDMDPYLPGVQTIGTIPAVFGFSGILDGNGFAIKNFSSSQGLFYSIDDTGIVKNLGMENVNISNNSYSYESLGVGAICGDNHGAIVNCYATGTIVSEKVAGGICGQNGYSWAYTDQQIISGCFANVNITCSTTAGGLCGVNDSRGAIINSYSNGDVILTGEAYYGGGFCGRNDEYDNSIYNCYSTGSVSGLEGGVGGFCGSNKWGSIENCFWDTETSGLEESTGGTGLTTAQMQDINTFADAGWDFNTEVENGTEDIWHMPYDSEGYPMLWYQRDIPGDLSGKYGVDMTDFEKLASAWLSNENSDLSSLQDMAENWLMGITNN